MPVTKIDITNPVFPSQNFRQKLLVVDF